MDILTSIASYQEALGTSHAANKPPKHAVIDPSYVASSYPGTLPKVTFEGEGTLSEKFYAVMGPYRPVPNDRVVMLPIGTTYLIIGNIPTTLPTQFPSLVTIGTFRGGGGTSVTTVFNSIDQSFMDLLLTWRGRHSGGNVYVSLATRFNGDNGDNYYAGSARTLDSSWAHLSSANLSVIRTGHVGGQSGTHGTMWIPSYSVNGRAKAAHGTSLMRGIEGSSTQTGFGVAGGYWTGTVPVTSIQLWPSGQTWEGDLECRLVGIR